MYLKKVPHDVFFIILSLFCCYMLATGYYMLFVYVMFGCVYFFFSVCVRVCEICTRIHHFFLIFFLCIFLEYIL